MYRTPKHDVLHSGIEVKARDMDSLCLGEALHKFNERWVVQPGQHKVCNVDE
jgi:hypothetical protein